MVRFIAVAFGAACISIAAAAQPRPIEFKGIPLGGAKDDLLAKFPGIKCAKPWKSLWRLGEESCTAGNLGLGVTYAGAPAWEYSFNVIGNRLEGWNALIDPSSFDVVRAALIEAYGPGKDSTAEYSTVGGAPLTGRRWEFTATDGSMVGVYEYASRRDRGAVGATSSALEKWRNSKPNLDAKKNASDI